MGYVTWLRASNNLPVTCLNWGKAVGLGLCPSLSRGGSRKEKPLQVLPAAEGKLQSLRGLPVMSPARVMDLRCKSGF